MFLFNESTKIAINDYSLAIKGLELLVEKIIKDSPKNLKETYIFQKIKEHNDFKNVKLEEINWLLKLCSTNRTINELKQSISTQTKKSKKELFNYIDYIVNSKRIRITEKIVILLSHFEPLLYLVFNTVKQKGMKIKIIASNKLVEINEPSTENIGLLLSIAITKIVFANTDTFTYIDKRLPFRNNILHNGILDYNLKHIKILYKILLSFVLTAINTTNKHDNN